VIHLLVRRPTPADYPAVIRVADDWWGSRQVPGVLSRLWFEHFAGTSSIAHTVEGELAGFLVAFVSPDHPADVVVVLGGTNPNLRRRGVGRRLHSQLASDAQERGARRILEAVFPGDPGAVAFLRAIGFVPLEMPGTQRLYGIPALANHEWGREDRSLFVRDLDDVEPQAR
jgi:ribosomal protein S18 acetylase RimI-like enzyme